MPNHNPDRKIFRRILSPASIKSEISEYGRPVDMDVLEISSFGGSKYDVRAAGLGRSQSHKFLQCDLVPGLNLSPRMGLSS
jgi:hypothetical protein